MSERVSPQKAKLKEGVVSRLTTLVSDINGRTPISQLCFLLPITELEQAQQLVKELQFQVNQFDGTPELTSVFGRFYGENQDQIVIFWKARLGNTIKLAIDQINRERKRNNLPPLPVFDES